MCSNTDGSYLCSCMTDYYLSSSTECDVITFRTLISGSALSSSSLQIDWDTSFTPATHTVSLSYQVYYRDITFSVPSYTYHGETNSLHQDISNLLPYRDYQLYVDAIGSLTSQTSNTVSVTTDQDTPSESPTSVSVLTLSATEISLSWFAPSIESQNGVLEYYVILINATSSSHPGWTTTQINITASSTFHTITGLKPYTAYTLSVSAATSVGRGPYSTSTTVTTHESTPTQPPRLSVTSKTHSTISLTLRPPTDTDTLNGVITYYLVTYTGVNVDTSTRTARVMASSTDNLSAVSDTLIGLQEGVSYSIKASVSTSVGTGPNSDSISVTTDEIAPTGTPQNIVFTSILNSSLSFEWGAVVLSEQNGVITGYRVSYKGVITDIELRNVTLATTSVTLNNLSEGTEYIFYICALNSIGEGPCISVTQSTSEILPSGTPTMFLVDNRASTSLSLSWSLPLISERNGIITGFNLVLIEFVSDEEVSQANVNGTTFFFQFTELAEYHKYSISIRAINSIGYGPYDQLLVATTEASPEGAPTNFTGVATTTTIILSWIEIPADQHNGQLINYEITYFNQVPFLLHTHVDVNISITELHHIVTGLEEGVSYHFTIRAYTSVGPGPNSSEISVRTLEALPSSAPTDLQVSVLSATQIQLTYEYPLGINQNGEITGFDMSLTSATDSIQHIISTTLTSYTLSSLHPYTTYCIQVRANNSIGAGPYTAVNIVTTNQALPADAPTQLTVLQMTHNSVNFSWYQIASSSLNGEFLSYTILVTNTLTTDTFSQSSLYSQTSITELTPYTQYSLSVAVVNTQGTGPYSSSLNFSTNQYSPSQGPQILPIQHITNNSAFVQFTHIPVSIQNGPIISYTLNLHTTADSLLVTSLNNSPINTPSFLLTDLLPYREYTVLMTGTNSAGTSPSTSINFVTLEYFPSGPPTSILATPYSTYVVLLFQPPEASQQNGIISEFSIRFGDSTYTTNTTQYTVWNLEEFTQFQFSIAASTSVGIGPYSEVFSVTTLSAPPTAAPQNVTGTALSYYSILVSWDHIPADHQNGVILSYIVYFQGQEHDTSERKKTVGATDTEAVITPLKPGESYSIVVIAKNTGGASPVSARILVRTFEGLPTAAPTGIFVVHTSSSSYRVSWVGILSQHHNGLLLSYEVVSQDTTYDTSPISLTTAANVTSLEVTGVHPAAEYTVHVFAVNAIGKGPVSDSVSVSLPESFPSTAPVILDSSSTTDTILLVWTEIDEIDRNGVILRYQLRYTESADTQFIYFIVSASVLNTTLMDLNADTYYIIQIRAYTSVGPGPFSPEQEFSTSHRICTVCMNGECVQENEYSICQCHPGFTGEICDINIDECLSANCDHGDCTDGDNMFICECDTGYLGMLCDIPVGTPVCAQESYLNFLWPDTAYDTTVTLSCSDSDPLLFGSANRSCSTDGFWMPPEVNSCKKKLYLDLDSDLDIVETIPLSPDEIVASITVLQNIICNFSSESGPTFFPGEIDTLIQVLETVLYSIDVLKESIRIQLLPQVMPGILCMLSGILDPRNLEMFTLSSNSELAVSINDLLERVASLNAENYDTTNSDPTLYSQENIHMYIAPLTDEQSITLPDNELSAVYYTGSVTIPESEVSTLFSKSNGKVPVVAVVFSRYLGVAIGSSYLSTGLSLDSTVITSVISVQNSLGEALTFSSPITLTLPLLPTATQSDRYHTCVYWDNTAQAWTSSGLSYVTRDSDDVICSSNHATSFSVLSSSSPGVTDANTLENNYIYAGVGVVVLCLMLVSVCCILIVCMCLLYSRKRKYRSEAQHRQSESVNVLLPSRVSFPNPLYGSAYDDISKADSLKKDYSIKTIENPYEFRTQPNKLYIPAREGYDDSGTYSTFLPGLYAHDAYSEIQHDPSMNPFNGLTDGDYAQMDPKDVKNQFLGDSDGQVSARISQISNPII